MMKIKVVLIAIGIFAIANSFAQKASKQSDKVKLSIGVEGALPVGDLSKSSSFGVGGSVDVAFPIFEGGAVTFSPGYINFFHKKVDGGDVKDFQIIPIKAGLRFALAEKSGFYGEPQLGYTKYSGEGAGGAFTYAAKVGYMMDALDLSLRYEASSKSQDVLGVKTTYTNGFVGLRVAYSFGL